MKGENEDDEEEEENEASEWKGFNVRSADIKPFSNAVIV